MLPINDLHRLNDTLCNTFVTVLQQEQQEKKDGDATTTILPPTTASRPISATTKSPLNPVTIGRHSPSPSPSPPLGPIRRVGSLSSSNTPNGLTMNGHETGALPPSKRLTPLSAIGVIKLPTIPPSADPLLPPTHPNTVNLGAADLTVAASTGCATSSTRATISPLNDPVILGQVELVLLQSLDALALNRIFHLLHSTVLPNVTAFEWAKKRDLPPILMKKIVRPSSSVYHMKTFLTGLIQDCQRLPALVAIPLLTHAIFQTAHGMKETLLSITPSRFHSRQFFVDLTATLIVLRSFVQYMEKRCAEVVATPDGEGDGVKLDVTKKLELYISTSSCTKSMFHQLNSVLIEVAIAVLITHPTGIKLPDLIDIVTKWSQTWKSNSSQPSTSTSICLTTFSQQIAQLWQCEAFVTSADLSSTTSASNGASSGFLQTFFRLPKLNSNSIHAEASIAQDLPFDFDPVTVLQAHSSAYLTHLTPTALIRLIQLRHELREDDYPELSVEDQGDARKLRTLIQHFPSQLQS